jgi:hypothetical protein
LKPACGKITRLIRWKRVGIVASVVWILGAGIYTFLATSDADVRTASGLTLSCEESHNGHGSDECDKRCTDYLDEVRPSEGMKAALIALVPVPLVWVAIYLGLFLVRLVTPQETPR